MKMFFALLAGKKSLPKYYKSYSLPSRPIQRHYTKTARLNKNVRSNGTGCQTGRDRYLHSKCGHRTGNGN